eukprot:TRINITY_DN10706_c3_g1_i1.p1 TRINITY_DN10706_c3_g1~~TRINITY_DN10706_c3_g1_i1.p1  ORF type:complete len:318 (+),score=55.15 TRINITY_DN10706_c3_g1_i1:62-1015(+)
MSSDSEEDDAEEEEFIAPPPPQGPRKHRTSVSAEAFGEWNQRVAFEPPVYPKTPEQFHELKEVAGQSILFSSLEPKDLEVVVNAMKGPIPLDAGLRIIQEGDDGEHLYVISDGAMDIVKVIDGVETVLKTCYKGDLFGELALMYNCPRAASVQSREASILYELDRATFNNIVMEAVLRKRSQLLTVLRKVPLFQNMTQGELENVIDTLKIQRYPYGSTIIRQGEEGEHFFIVYEGQVVASRVDPSHPEPQNFVHEAGDYFGELALLRDAPRAASVVASSDPEACLLSMDRATFKRLMGSVETFLGMNATRYSTSESI